MKNLLLFITVCSCSFLQLKSQDLPGPPANLQTLPGGSYVIAMDNTLQTNSAGNFNLKVYGLVVYLLDNNIKIKWSIKAGKSKDAADFTATAEQLMPTLVSGGTSKDFKAGPFVILASDTAGVAALANSFYTLNSLTGNNRPKIYRLTADAGNVGIRYDMSGFMPKAAILTDGNNQNIHISYMNDCSIPVSNYATSGGSDLLIKCFTFASEPHNATANNTIIFDIKMFVKSGGNFLAQCEAIETYENASSGHFHTTNGITVTNTTVSAANTVYPNADLAFSQYEGTYNINQGGSVANWTLAAGSSFTNNENNHATGGNISTQTPVGASFSKLNSSGNKGGLVFYLGNHKFSSVTDINSINGIRMYMNAFLTPVSINNNCNTGDYLDVVLPLNLTDFNGTQKNGTVTLNWTVASNEITGNYEVQRSADGENFSSAAFIPGTGKPGFEMYDYSELMKGTHIYYRLKMTHKNQAITYSKVLVFLNSASSSSHKISVINDPLNNKVTLTFKTSSRQPIAIKVIDLTGREMMRQSLNSTEGNNFIDIDLPAAMMRNIYVLYVCIGADHYSEKIVKR